MPDWLTNGDEQRVAGAARLAGEARGEADAGDLPRDGGAHAALAAGAAAAGEAGADVVEVEHRDGERREQGADAQAGADIVEAEAVAADGDRPFEAGRLVGAGQVRRARPRNREEVQPRLDVAERDRPDLGLLQRAQPDAAGRRARGQAALAEAEPVERQPHRQQSEQREQEGRDQEQRPAGATDPHWAPRARKAASTASVRSPLARAQRIDDQAAPLHQPHPGEEGLRPNRVEREGGARRPLRRDARIGEPRLGAGPADEAVDRQRRRGAAFALQPAHRLRAQPRASASAVTASAWRVCAASSASDSGRITSSQPSTRPTRANMTRRRRCSRSVRSRHQAAPSISPPQRQVGGGAAAGIAALAGRHREAARLQPRLQRRERRRAVGGDGRDEACRPPDIRGARSSAFGVARTASNSRCRGAEAGTQIRAARRRAGRERIGLGHSAVGGEGVSEDRRHLDDEGQQGERDGEAGDAPDASPVEVPLAAARERALAQVQRRRGDQRPEPGFEAAASTVSTGAPPTTASASSGSRVKAAARPR